MTVFGSTQGLCDNNVIRCSATGGGGGAWGHAPPMIYVYFLQFIYLFICFIIIIFFACRLRAQSCTLMIIIPRTHYDSFATIFSQVGKKCVTVPFLHPPPPFFLASQLRGQSYMLMMITPLSHYNFSTNFFRSGKNVSGAPPPPHWERPFS